MEADVVGASVGFGVFAFGESSELKRAGLVWFGFCRIALEDCLGRS